MSTINKTLLIGNIANDPYIKTLEGGVKVATFCLATNYVHKGPNGEKKDEAEFHNCVAFGGIAELIEKYAVKGQKNYVEGRLRTRSWEDENGQKRYKTEIVVENFTMLSKKQDGMD